MKKIKITESQFQALQSRINEEKTESKSVINILKDAIIVSEDDEYELDIYNIYDVVTNWPTGEDEEGLDLENFEILSLDESGMEMSCGGDWQTPKKFKLVLDGDKLKAIDIKTDTEFKDGISHEEIIKILTT